MKQHRLLDLGLIVTLLSITSPATAADAQGGLVPRHAPITSGMAVVTWSGRPIVLTPGVRRGVGAVRGVVVTPPQHGKVQPKRNGRKFRYAPAKDYVGEDSFTFKMIDSRGVESRTTTVTITIGPGEGDVRYTNGIRFLPPPHLVATKATDNRLFRLGYLDVTLYDGWQGNPVDPSGAKDSTLALQKAIDDAYDYQLAVYFPPGTYTVSDTLRVIRKRARFAEGHGTTLQGSTSDARPVIRLSPRTPGFSDPEKPKPVVWVWTAMEGHERIFGTPASEFGTNAKARWAAMGFCQAISNLIIDCNGTNGNAGAIGLRFGAAQNSKICDVKVIARGAFAGIYDIPSRSSSGAANVEVVGGKYGMFLSQGAGSVIVGATLRDQETAAVHTNHFVPLAMVGVHIEKEQGPAITLRGNWNSSGGTLSLVDARVELRAGGPAFDNRAGRNLYLRNVYVRGAEALALTGKSSVTSHGAWQRIGELVCTDQRTYDDDPPYEYQDHGFESFTVLNGRVGREQIANVAPDAPAPPADLVSRHVWQKRPSFEDPDTAVLTDVCAVDGSDDADDWQVFQQAVDEHRKIFVPKGRFRLSRTLTLRANTILFGTGPTLSRIYSHPSWKPTAEATIIATVDDPEATTYLGSMHLGYQWDTRVHDWFNLLHWRAGRRSMVMGIAQRYGAEGRRWQPKDLRSNPHGLYKVTGSGGGRWYFWGVDQTGPNLHRGYRHLLIDGTHEPLTFYGFNLEKGLGLCRCEIRRSSNVRMFSVKIEGRRPIVWVHDSENIGLFSSGAMREHVDGFEEGKPAPYYWITGQSNNVLLANVCPQRPGPGRGTFTLLEDSALGRTAIAYPEMISVFKRGELDDGAMGK